jgi:hypothetical protein
MHGSQRWARLDLTAAPGEKRAMLVIDELSLRVAGRLLIDNA